MISELSNLEKRFFYHQFLTLAQAEMPLEQATELMAEHRPTLRLSEMSKIMAFSFREGKSLSDFMRACPAYFSSYEFNIVKAGEESDNLKGCLQWLADLYTRETEYGRMERIQFWYSMFIIFFGLVIIVLFNIVVIPAFQGIYSAIFLPNLTSGIIAVSNFFRSYWFYLLPVIFITVRLIWQLWHRYPVIFSLIITGIPGIGNSWMFQESLRFLLVIGQAIESGVHPLTALDDSADFVTHPYLKKRLKAMVAFIGEGQTWASAFKNIWKFPKLLIGFVQLGEDQGDLGPAFSEIAYRIECHEISNKWQLLRVILFMVVMCYIFIIYISAYTLIFPFGLT